jgi:hypothetical protein
MVSRENAMSQNHYTKEEVVRRGEEIYERDLRAQVEPAHLGKFIVIDIETGDYEIDEKAFAATRRVAARHPDGARCLLRIGAPAAFNLYFGGRRP